MKNHLLLLVVLLLVGQAVQSQTPYRQFGIKTGVNVASAQLSPGSQGIGANTSAMAGGNFSLTFDRVLLRFITLGFEFNYVNRGFKVPITFNDVNGNPLGTLNASYKFNYASIPLKLGFQVGNKNYFFGNVALVSSVLTKAVNQIEANSSLGFPASSADIYSQAQQYAFSKQAEIGMGITPVRNVKFYFSLSKLFSMTNFFNAGATNVFNYRPNDLAINVGMKLEFGKGLLR